MFLPSLLDSYLQNLPWSIQGNVEVQNQGPASLLHDLRSRDSYIKIRLGLRSFLVQQPLPWSFRFVMRTPKW